VSRCERDRLGRRRRPSGESAGRFLVVLAVARQVVGVDDADDLDLRVDAEVFLQDGVDDGLLALGVTLKHLLQTGPGGDPPMRLLITRARGLSNLERARAALAAVHDARPPADRPRAPSTRF